MTSSFRILCAVGVLVLANAFPAHMTANQAVWERIKMNQERKAEAKKLVAPPVVAAVQHDEDVSEDSKIHQVRAAPKKKSVPAASFVQKKHQGTKMYASIPQHGKRSSVVTRANKPVGRKATKPAFNMKKEMKYIAAEVNALKKKHEQGTATPSNTAGNQKHMTAAERKPLVDQVWKPPTEKKVAQKPEPVAAVSSSGEDPFSSMSEENFNEEQNSEMRKAKNLLKTKTLKAEPEINEDISTEVNDEVKKTTKAVEAIAGADVVSESTKEDLKTTTENAKKGLDSMEKDAEAMVASADDDAEKEAQDKQAKAKAAMKADAILKEDLSGKKVKAEEKPVAPKKVETLAEAEREARAAENLEKMSKMSEGLAGNLVKGDKKLNSELSEDVAVNNHLVHEKIQRVQAIEDNKKADLLDNIDAQWRTQFPDAPSTKDDAKLTQRQGKKGVHKKAVSEWGTLANNLADGVVA